VIRTQADLERTRTSLLRFENGMRTQRQEIENVRNFELLTEGDVEIIARLRDEIDVYLGLIIEQPMEILGIIASVDVDQETFILRSSSPDQSEMVCAKRFGLTEDIDSILGESVRVIGMLQRHRITKRIVLKVESITVVERATKIDKLPSNGVVHPSESSITNA